MNFDKLVESIIKEAMERGEFDDLPGKGKPIDLSAYFETPEDVRMAYSILKNAGMNAREADLLKEIAELKQIRAAVLDEKRKRELHKEIDKEADRVQPDAGAAKASAQAKVIRTEAGGSGIGLTIARALVEAQGGRIWVETTAEGQGSVFAFTLPIAK
ncbi:MAG: hypothetical protein OHK0041_01750 [Anaerolineales bacterium]